MSSLDFCNAYSTTGQIDQVGYAQKAADVGDTCIAMRGRNGIVFLAEKPLVSPLYVAESEERVKRLSSSVTVSCTGLASDVFYVASEMKEMALSYKEKEREDVHPGYVRMYLNELLNVFTRRVNLRVLGVNALVSVYKDGKFTLLQADCSGKTGMYRAACIGKGARRIKTELEKLDLEGMSVEEMVDAGVRMLYMAHDPSKDKAFDIEVGVASVENGGIVRKLEKEEIQVFVERHCHMSVDDDG